MKELMKKMKKVKRIICIMCVMKAEGSMTIEPALRQTRLYGSAIKHGKPVCKISNAILNGIGIKM